MLKPIRLENSEDNPVYRPDASSSIEGRDIQSENVDESNISIILPDIDYLLYDMDVPGKEIDLLIDTYPGLTREDAVELDSLARTKLSQRFNDKGQEAVVTLLPSVAPALWAERTSGREVSPVGFIQQHYGPWIGKGLTRPDLKRLDEPLYRAHTIFISRNGGVDPLNLPKKSDVVEARVSSSDFDDLRHAARRYQADRQKRYRMSRT